MKKSLQLPQALSIRKTKFSIVYIGCDLFDSTLHVLEYLAPSITNGSILIFDDWLSFAGNPYVGQIKAVNLWLSKNKSKNLIEFSRKNNAVAFFVQDFGNLSYEI